MDVTINGAPYDLPEGTTVAEVVRELTAVTSGVAVAVNDEVVARASWGTTLLAERDRVEVLTAVQGG
ncbi:sulfur carrier protein ThiS [Sphaerisporangium sp. B11E5]|uniref:sulfur carrier protein ThiS n=1 Tax=Sphaerisporangium sp. B11E5 TaxID=3153563 RepID=UPI00325C6AD2